MRYSIRHICLLVVVAFLGAGSLHAQTGFRAAGNGDWTDSHNWEVENNGIWLKPPDGVFPGESHNRDVDVIIDSNVTLIIANGPEIRINSLVMNTGKLVIVGNVVVGPTSDDPNNHILITPAGGTLGLSEGAAVADSALPISPSAELALQLDQNVPNPVSYMTGDWTTIKFYIDRSYANVRLSLYDQMGSELKRLYEAVEPTVGWISVRINVHELQSGSYPIVLLAGNSILRRSLTVIR